MAQPILSHSSQRAARLQPADTLATSPKLPAMHHAPGLHSAAAATVNVRVVDFGQDNSRKHIATPLVREQCRRVIANQRAVARTVLTIEIRARLHAV